MHLFGLYTYCKMMHGAYNVKMIQHVVINIEAYEFYKMHAKLYPTSFLLSVTVHAEEVVGHNQ